MGPPPAGLLLVAQRNLCYRPTTAVATVRRHLVAGPMRPIGRSGARRGMMHIMVGRVLIFLFLLILALIAIAMISVLSAEREEIRRLPRGAWVAIILLLPVLGSTLYLWLGRPIRRREPWAAATTPPRPPAPDDDPEFLRRLSTMTPPPPASERPTPEHPTAERPDRPAPDRPATVDPRTGEEQPNDG